MNQNQQLNHKTKKKLSKQQITTLIASIMLVLTHVAILLAIVLSFRYYAIYPSLFGSIVAIVVCLLIIVDIVFFIGFNHQDIALKVISCILAICLLVGGTVGTYFIARANGIVNNVLDSDNSKYETYSGTFVCFKKNNNFTSLNDLAGKKVGMLVETENGISYIAKGLLDDTKIDYATVDYKTNAEMVQALIDGDIDAMAITSAYRDIYSLERDENSPFAKYLEDFVDFNPFEKELKSSSNRRAKNVSTEPFNVLLIGYSRTDIGSPVGLADSIILATVNPQTYTVSMMSIARDSFVPIACYGGEYDKINSGRSTSRACFIETVENFVGMDIDYYMELDYLGLVAIVNTIGGILINNPVDFELDGIFVPAGNGVFADGQMALQFCRERHHMPNGDFDRQQHQKEVIIAIAEKFIQAGDVSLALKAMEEASDWMSTDLTLNQLTTLFNLLLNTKNYTGLDTFDLVNFQTLRMTGDGGLKYYSYSMHLPLWVYLIYQGSYDESMKHVREVMGNYNVINQDPSFEFSIRSKYEAPQLYSESYPDVFMYSPDPMPAYWAALDGLTVSEAMEWANANGVKLTIGETILPNDPKFKAEMEGLVIDQSIRYGSLISEYSSGTITVMGGGDINLDDYYVPNFIGQDVSEVFDWAEDHDIDVKGNGGIYSGRIVESQNPEPGTPIKGVTEIRVELKEPKEFTVTFDANGGKVSPSKMTVTEGTTYGELPTPVLSGKAFKGWYTEDGDYITSSSKVKGDITLYAEWEDAVTHTYKYVDEKGRKLDGGTFNEGEEIPNYKGDTPSKSSDNKYTYKFAGWDISYDWSGNVTLTAKFDAIPIEPDDPPVDPDDPPVDPDNPEEPENPDTPEESGEENE